jgi:hypothetical protein
MDLYRAGHIRSIPIFQTFVRPSGQCRRAGTLANFCFSFVAQPTATYSSVACMQQAGAAHPTQFLDIIPTSGRPGWTGPLHLWTSHCGARHFVFLSRNAGIGKQGQHLPCTTIDIGVIQDVGYLFENQDSLGKSRKMRGTGRNSVAETPLLSPFYMLWPRPPLPTPTSARLLETDS